MGWRQGVDPGHGWAQRLPLEEFKVCELCGSLNAQESHACFCCGWYGAFDTDPAAIELRFLLILDRCPNLTDLVLAPPPPTWRDRVRGTWRAWRNRRRRRLDVRA